jgi:hypothetical protein
MKWVAGALLFLALNGCEQTRFPRYPIDKQLPTIRTGTDSNYLETEVHLSFKADSLCYYNIKARTNWAPTLERLKKKEYLGASVLMFDLIDKHENILRVLIPRWQDNRREAIENGLSWRGKVKMNEGVFRDITTYEREFRSDLSGFPD